MKMVTILPQIDNEICRGCKICEKVCPVLAISVVEKKAVVDPHKCRACANCEQRCPFGAIKMVKRDIPIKVGINVSDFDQNKIRKICVNAHLNPEQVVCYCTSTRAEELAAAILNGATTPEELSLYTGVRTGCTIECIQPVLRILSANGYELKPIKNGWQWYGTTVTAWDLPTDVTEKYKSKGFYFEEDKELLDKIVHTNAENKGGENYDA